MPAGGAPRRRAVLSTVCGEREGEDQVLADLCLRQMDEHQLARLHQVCACLGVAPQLQDAACPCRYC